MKAERKNADRLLKTGLCMITVVYLYVLIRIVLFKYGFVSVGRSINMRPLNFLTMLSDGTALDVALKNILGNVAIFIPLGILSAYVLHRRKFLSVILCMAVSIIFELIQFVAGLGVTDIDDIILNTIGGFVGMILYKLILEKIDKKVKLPIAVFTFLSVFGLCGRAALFMYAPNILPADVEIVNAEVFREIDIDEYDIDTLAFDIEEDSVLTTTKSEAIYVPEGKAVTLEANGTYRLAKDAVFILEEHQYQYSTNGNIQKTTVIYHSLTKDAMKELLEKEERRVSLYLNEENECYCIVAIKW